jgi:hypothetical protein
VTRHDTPDVSLPAPRDEGGRRPWSVSPAQGVVQGPLDLSHFAGERLRLTLQEGQLALVERAGTLDDVLTPGVYDLPGDRPGRVFFVHVDRPVNWQWHDGAVLWVGPSSCRHAVPIIGACAVMIADIAVFYRAFLRGAPSLADGGLLHVLDTVVRDRLESRLERVTADGETDPATIQTLLAHVSATDLSEDLDEYGLACTHLAVYTRQAPVVEAALAGHFANHRDNNA